MLLLLGQLLRELEVISMGRHVGHLALNWILAREMLLRRDDAHVDILLMRVLDLLLLLLQIFDLTCERELMHCDQVSNRAGHGTRQMRTHQWREFGGAATVCNVETPAARSDGCVLSLLLHGHGKGWTQEPAGTVVGV